MSEHILRGLVAIVVLGVTAQWLATSLRLPSILLLLIFGFIAGPVTGILEPDRILGDTMFPFVSLSVALILYEGGLSLRLRELRRIGGVVRNLVTIGAVVTWGLGTLAALWFFGLYWKLALLLGAILVVTGPTVIVPLLRHVRPGGEVGSILRWEGIVIDSVGAILAVLTFEAIRYHHDGTTAFMGFLRAFLAGGGIGIAGAGLLYLMLRRYLIPDYLQNAVSLMMVVAVFSISNLIESESGVFAVTIMGIALANQPSINVKHIAEFKENLQVLLISSLFIILAADLDLEQLRGLVLGPAESATGIQSLARGLGVDPETLGESTLALLEQSRTHINMATLLLFLAFLIVVGRPIAVLISSIGCSVTWRERVFLCFMAPRGIVAAAVSSVFALRLASQSRMRLLEIDPTSEPELFQELFLLANQATLLVPLTFIVIIATVSFYGLGAPLVARWLRISQPNPQGALIVGAHPLARAIAVALRAEGCKVVLADTNWSNWQQARMEGLPIYYGNILTEYSLEELDFDGLGRLLALTRNDEVNSLAALHFLDTFGRREVYQLSPAAPAREKESKPKHLRGRHLFSEEATYDYLARRWEEGARVKTTRLTEAFDFESLKERYGETALPLFLVGDRGRIQVITSDLEEPAVAGKKLISLVDPVPGD